MKKLFSILLILSTLFSFVACMPGDGGLPFESTTPPSSEEIITSESAEETTEAPNPYDFPREDASREILLFENGKWNFSVTRPDVMRGTFEESFKVFRSMLKTVTNVEANASSDYLEVGKDYDDSKFEILFGNTSHKQSIKGYSDTCLGEASVFVVGNKITVNAYNEDGFYACIDHLREVFKANFKDGKLSVKVGDIEKVFNINENHLAAPIPDYLKFVAQEDCQYGQTLFLFSEAKEEDFDSYMKKFEGYTLVQEKSEAGNRFATYSYGATLINISYSNDDRSIRTILNEETLASPLMSPSAASTEKNCDNILILHGLAWGTSEQDIQNHQNGICMLIRLSNGSFIVIDGGFNRNQDATDLYNLLRKNTPGQVKPTIAAWFITHAHGDHHATFASRFIKIYGKMATVENVFFNPPSHNSNQTSSDEQPAEELVTSTAKSIDGCNLIRPHVGDRYYIGDAIVDFYYTVDRYYPESFTYYNTCSLIFSITIAGQKIMITGDGANASFKHMVAMFGESLKSDILQVAHHGYGTGVAASASTDIMRGYKCISPNTLLWPIGYDDYEKVSKYVYNKYVSTLSSVKEIIVAGDDDHIISLPYTPNK